MVIVAGMPGAPGTDGNPALPGGRGENGESVEAVAEALFEDNTANVLGGRGGAGGVGGDAIAGSGGVGGDGGNGGNATAIATTFGASVVNAIARGGQPGQGGRGGDGAPGPVPQPDGEDGLEGRPGDASAYATIENTYGTDDAAPGLNGLAEARGYYESDIQTGDVFATIQGEATGDGPAGRVHDLAARAIASRSREINGDAFAEANGSTTHGVLNVEAVAFGGDGGHLIGPRTGTAGAIATGTHSGEGELNVHASVDGNSALVGEVADISASGIATGGADVLVRADIDAGPTVEVRDAVSGSTSGLLRLQQYVDARGYDLSQPEMERERPSSRKMMAAEISISA